MRMLLVAEVSVSKPLLNVIIYKKNPIAPDRRKRGMSRNAGGWSFLTSTKGSRTRLAIMYRSNPMALAEKKGSATLVNTNPLAHKATVDREYKCTDIGCFILKPL